MTDIDKARARYMIYRISEATLWRNGNFTPKLRPSGAQIRLEANLVLMFLNCSKSCNKAEKKIKNKYMMLLYHTYVKKSRLDSRTLMLYYGSKLIRFTGFH